MRLRSCARRGTLSKSARFGQQPKKDEASPAESWSSTNLLVENITEMEEPTEHLQDGALPGRRGLTNGGERLAGRDKRRAKDEPSQVFTSWN